MSGKYRVFGVEFKQNVAQRILNGESVTALHHELQIKRSVLYRWSSTIRWIRRALADRAVEPGIVHHSDRGVQYCSQTYVERLQAYGFAISMSRAGNPYDNGNDLSANGNLSLISVPQHKGAVQAVPQLSQITLLLNHPADC
ncbi:MAG: hypothetical protein LAP39_28960 [Acidobacteriia bacterium]|nr:hypothetical protein [Terriglobia bacterium]